MNRFNFKVLMSEFFSLVLLVKMIENLILSQKVKAVKPNRQTMAFFMPITGQFLPYTGYLRLCFMVWLILQNKPLGEYVERLLLLPRVRPNHPILAVLSLTQNVKGGYHA